MIGMVNVQCDTPLDYYATAPNLLSRDTSIRKRGDSESANRKSQAPTVPPHNPPDFSKPSQFHKTHSIMASTVHRATKKKSSKPKYLKDGRKLTEEGSDEPNKLWEELFLRSFAHKIEQEISSPSPLEAHKNLNSELSKLKIQDKSFYRSTYSLVSPTRIENIDFEELERIERQDEDQEELKPNRSNSSTERPSSQICSVFLPFIKTIKGNKKKNSISSSTSSSSTTNNNNSSKQHSS